MTNPKATIRGVEKIIEERCDHCAYGIMIRDGLSILKIYCTNAKSDHFGHLICVIHPACDQIKVKEKPHASSL